MVVASGGGAVVSLDLAGRKWWNARVNTDERPFPGHSPDGSEVRLVDRKTSTTFRLDADTGKALAGQHDDDGEDGSIRLVLRSKDNTVRAQVRERGTVNLFEQHGAQPFARLRGKLVTRGDG
ncbi:MAG: hypothetical protein ACR2RL_11680, partial [Gammaproteobacteria bacterium]